MRAEALKCYVVGKHEGGVCLAPLVVECSVQKVAILGRSSYELIYFTASVGYSS